MRRNLRPIIRQLDFTQSEEVIEKKVEGALKAIETEDYDFSKYSKQTITKNNKQRIVYSFETLSVENIICHYLKKEIDRVFQVKYASRAKIISLLFNTLPVIKDMNDFVIIRADFKDFFNSVLTEHVYKNYIQGSDIRRGDKDIIKKYIDVFQYCYAGLCLSNELAEIVCRDFDRLLKAKLEVYGVFFYERYVDDMLIMLKTYIDKDALLDIISSTIKEVFGNCPVSLSMDVDKFSFITCRKLEHIAGATPGRHTTERFSFLGYEFLIDYSKSKNKDFLTFKYGITKKKRDRYEHIIEAAFIDYKKNRNTELLRQRIKLFSTRIVVPRTLGNKQVEWLMNGLISNYGELRYHMTDLESDTELYLKSLFSNIMIKHCILEPYYLKQIDGQESIYNLYSNLKRKRSIIFDKKIGVQRKDLVKWIRKLQPDYTEANKRYYQIVMEYFELLSANSTTS